MLELFCKDKIREIGSNEVYVKCDPLRHMSTDKYKEGESNPYF